MAAVAPGSSLVATATVPVISVYPTPGASSPMTSLANPNDMGAPLVMLVRVVQGQWLNVMLPARPNEAEGWIPASQVTLATDPYAMDVSLSAHTLTVFQGGQAVLQVPIAVGTSSAPTPTGSFFLTELLKAPDPNGAYGPFAYGTSDFSNTYTEFEGGPGQIGIHGTDQPWVIGHDASHGCIRMTDDNILKVSSMVPVGTPVNIHQ